MTVSQDAPARGDAEAAWSVAWVQAAQGMDAALWMRMGIEMEVAKGDAVERVESV